MTMHMDFIQNQQCVFPIEIDNAKIRCRAEWQTSCLQPFNQTSCSWPMLEMHHVGCAVRQDSRDNTPPPPDSLRSSGGAADYQMNAFLDVIFDIRIGLQSIENSQSETCKKRFMRS